MQTVLRVPRLILLYSAALIGSVLSLTYAHGQTFIQNEPAVSAEMLAELDSEFQQVLDGYLADRSSLTVKDASVSDLSVLVSDRYPPLANLRRIREHLPSVLRLVDSQETLDLLDYLYQHNDTATVRKITDQMKASGSAAIKSKHYLLLAQYYNSRENWAGVRAALSNIDRGSLVEQDQQYYYLLMGYALQQLKEHRKAYRFYRKIASSSPYYAHAKLNEGTAYLRQGWWTEAHIEIDKAIEATKASNDPELLDRLYVILGYSQLHYEFYRDARMTLRNVNLNSRYTNKALMGLGLSAAYQKDFAGAINAFKILSQKQPKDLNVDEVMLLLPKAYEEVGNLTLAMEHFQNAIDYFNAKLREIGRVEQKVNNSPPSTLTAIANPNDRAVQELFAAQQVVPPYIYSNFEALNQMQKTVSPRMSKAVDKLVSRYANQIKLMASDSLKVRSAMVDSYLSQAKLGMAKLYDQE